MGEGPTVTETITGAVAHSGAWHTTLQGPGCPVSHPHLLLSLDPHVLRPLLAVFAFIRAACWALGRRLQPRRSRSHHLHGWHTATTTLWKEKQGWGGTVLRGTLGLGGVSGVRTSAGRPLEAWRSLP